MVPKKSPNMQKHKVAMFGQAHAAQRGNPHRVGSFLACYCQMGHEFCDPACNNQSNHKPLENSTTLIKLVATDTFSPECFTEHSYQRLQHLRMIQLACSELHHVLLSFYLLCPFHCRY